MQNKEYLNTVKSYLERHYDSEVVSIILFGSLVDNLNEVTDSTDVDLLVVIKDTCSGPLFDKIYRELLSIEAHYISTKDSFLELFRKGLQRATGMFVNLFYCRYSDITQKNFTKVFGVNPLMAFLFAPKTSVWISLKHLHSVIWGEDVFARNSKILSIQFSDILRSLTMNLLLSVGAISLSFITRSMTHFAMESVKWSLFTWKNSEKLSITSLLMLCRRYAQNASFSEKRLLSAFLMFRKTRMSNNYLLLFAPMFIFGLHRKLIQNMKATR